MPISLFTAMELSTLIQGAGEVLESDVEQRLKEKVIDFKQTVDEMPPANVTQSNAKKDFVMISCRDLLL